MAALGYVYTQENTNFSIPHNAVRIRLPLDVSTRPHIWLESIGALCRGWEKEEGYTCEKKNETTVTYKTSHLYALQVTIGYTVIFNALIEISLSMAFNHSKCTNTYIKIGYTIYNRVHY